MRDSCDCLTQKCKQMESVRITNWPMLFQIHKWRKFQSFSPKQKPIWGQIPSCISLGIKAVSSSCSHLNHSFQDPLGMSVALWCSLGWLSFSLGQTGAQATKPVGLLWRGDGVLRQVTWALSWQITKPTQTDHEVSDGFKVVCLETCSNRI